MMKTALADLRAQIDAEIQELERREGPQISYRRSHPLSEFLDYDSLVKRNAERLDRLGFLSLVAVQIHEEDLNIYERLLAFLLKHERVGWYLVGLRFQDTFRYVKAYWEKDRAANAELVRRGYHPTR